MPTLSLAMATYNGAQYIAKQLESLAGQTLLPTELVICDDQSTDDTARIIEDFARSAPFPVRFHQNETRLGYRANFMKCAGLCAGDYIAFCDQDDIWYKERNARCMAAFNDSAILLVYNNARVIRNDGTDVRKLYPQTTDSVTSGPLVLSPWFFALGFTITFRRELLTFSTVWPRSLNYTDAAIPLSHDQWIPLLANVCGKVSYVSQVLADYRMHDKNVSLKQTNKLRKLLDEVLASRERSAHAYNMADRIAELLAELAQLQSYKKQELQAGADFYGNIASHMQRRMYFYKERSLFKRFAILNELIGKKTYDNCARGGLGAKVLLKDLVFGLPFARLAH